MVSNIDIFQGIVSKLEIPVSWQHYDPLEIFIIWCFGSQDRNKLNCLCSGNYQLYSSKCLLFNVPRVCIELGKTAFSYYAPWAWYNSQKDLKLDKFVSVGEFKGIIKRVILEACDSFCWEVMLKYCCMCTCCVLKLSYCMAATLARSLL